MGATEWLVRNPRTTHLAIGYFGASTEPEPPWLPPRTVPIESERSSPAAAVPTWSVALAEVRAPTLLIVGGHDVPVIGLNQTALASSAPRKSSLVIVPGATHLFEEPGALEQVARLATARFTRYLEPFADGCSERRA